MQHAYWELRGSIWIPHLNHQRTGANSIQIWMIITLTQYRLEVHFGCWISPSGGATNKKQTQSTLIYLVWRGIYCLSFQIVSVWMPVCFFWWDSIGWRQSKSTGRMLYDKVVLRLCAPAYTELLAGDNPALDTMHIDNSLQLQRQAKEWKLRRIANVNYFWEIWQGSQNLHAPCIIFHSKQAMDSCRIHFKSWRDCQSILVNHSTRWCGCIYIVQNITLPTSCVCNEPSWRTNSQIQCLPNQKNQPSSSRNWWG